MRSFALLLTLALLTPCRLAAQDYPLDPVRALAAGEVKATWLADQGSWMVGGKVGLLFQDRLSLSAAGYALASSVAVGGTDAGSSFRLDLGYGGLLTEYQLRRGEDLDLTVGGLVGAAVGEVSAPAQQILITADNFFVLEPEVTLRYRLLPWLRATASAGYRLAWGVSLPGVGDGDLEAATFSVGLHVGR
jgi:hypothetical protein